MVVDFVVGVHVALRSHVGFGTLVSIFHTLHHLRAAESTSTPIDTHSDLNLLDHVHSARDRYMKPNGLMVPSQTRIMLAGITGEGMYNEAFGFWDRVYGACPLRSSE